MERRLCHWHSEGVARKRFIKRTDTGVQAIGQ